MSNLSIGFYNGDLRSVYMANYLSQNYNVYTYNINTEKLNINVNVCTTPEELFRKSSIIIPPVSLFINNEEAVSSFCEYVSKCNFVFGGCFPNTLISCFKEKNIRYFDYMDNEEFVQYNTISTAEGVISTIISETDINMAECKILVTGYGRCAKTLARKLNSLCFETCICARKQENITDAKANNCCGILLTDLKDKVNNYQIIINTVPAMIFNRDVLFKVSRDTLIIDIASKPGGVDFEYCKQKGIKALHCLGLPGKYAPRATAIFLSRMLMKIISAHN